MDKICQNRHNFISEQVSNTLFACMAGFSGSTISNMPSKSSREPRELPWQPNLDKKGKMAQISILCKKSRNYSHLLWSVQSW